MRLLELIVQYDEACRSRPWEEAEYQNARAALAEKIREVLGELK